MDALFSHVIFVANNKVTPVPYTLFATVRLYYGLSYDHLFLVYFVHMTTQLVMLLFTMVLQLPLFFTTVRQVQLSHCFKYTHRNEI